MLINGINIVKRNGFISIEYVDLSVKSACKVIKQHELEPLLVKNVFQRTQCVFSFIV